MLDGRTILNYLNAQEAFWYWGLNHIDITDSSLDFRSSRQGNDITFQVAMTDKGFVVRLYKAGVIKKRKLMKSYRAIRPEDLPEVISNVVFHQPAVA